MKTPQFTSSGEIFRRFAGYVRGVVVAHGVNNRESPEDLVRPLREGLDASDAVTLPVRWAKRARKI